MLICGSSFWSPALVSTSPGVSAIRLTTPSASSPRTFGSGPKTRTTIAPLVPVRTSLMRSRR